MDLRENMGVSVTNHELEGEIVDWWENMGEWRNNACTGGTNCGLEKKVGEWRYKPMLLEGKNAGWWDKP